MRLSQEEALKRLQATEFEILKLFASFCAEHELTWWLESGTALGAVRHNGFIPWDDDIDVGMLRDDYNRFMRLACDKNLFPKGYSVHNHHNTKHFAPMFGKIWKDGTKFYTAETLDAKLSQGIFIDVFPYDKVFKGQAQQKHQLRNARKWQTVSYLAQSGSASVPHGGIVGLAERAACKVGHVVIHGIISEHQIGMNFSNSLIPESIQEGDQIITLAWPEYEPFDLSVIVPTTMAEFEGEHFPIPGQHETYLTALYGDWRKIPPKSEQKSHLPVLIDFGDGDFYSSRY